MHPAPSGASRHPGMLATSSCYNLFVPFAESSDQYPDQAPLFFKGTCFWFKETLQTINDKPKHNKKLTVQADPDITFVSSPTSQPLACRRVRATQGHEGTQVQRIHTELFKQFPKEIPSPAPHSLSLMAEWIHGIYSLSPKYYFLV